MKIGIISNYKWLKQWDNYGTLFQNYALQKVLRSWGHETVWIRTVNEVDQRLSEKVKNLWLKASRSPEELFQQLLSVTSSYINADNVGWEIKAFNNLNPRNFDLFFDKNVPITKQEYGSQDLQRNPPLADVYIVGSDNVWENVNRTSFLEFAPKGSLRVGYAVSAPWDQLSRYWYAKARKAIKNLDSVSVREADGVEVCRRIGRSDAVHVLDPTLLLEPEDYHLLVANDDQLHDNLQRPVVGYLLNINRQEDYPHRLLKGLAEKWEASLKVIPLQGTELFVPKDYLHTPDPVGWLQTIRNSRCLITNSFHGIVFAILFQKNFVVIPCSRGGNINAFGRFTSLLNLLGLENRIFRGSSVNELHHLFEESIDWTSVQQRLRVARKSSLKYLREAIVVL
jgi:hypothetical protein